MRGIAVLTPNAEDAKKVHHVIYDELFHGIMSSDARNEHARIIGQLKEAGAEEVILGCTEIGLLIHQEDSLLPVFGTTEIHATKAALRSIG